MESTMNMKRFSMSFCLLSLVLLLTACEASQTSVRKVGSLDTGAAYSVFVQDDFAFVATNDGVVIIDISERKHPKKTALIDLKKLHLACMHKMTSSSLQVLQMAW